MIPDAQVNDKIYPTKIKLKDASLSVAQNFTVTDEGDIKVDLPLLSLSLSSDNVQITFNSSDPDDHFIHEISGIVNKIKNYTLINSNSIILDNKNIIRDIHEKAAQLFTEMNFTAQGYRIWTKFQTPNVSGISVNPFISSNYISGFQKVYLKNEDTNDTKYVNQRMKRPFIKDLEEKILMPVVDPSGDDLQLVLSEDLLRLLSQAVWNSTKFLANNNPIFTSPYIYITGQDKKVIAINCTTDLLETMFPGIVKEYGTKLACEWSFKAVKLDFFTINIGRLYSKNNIQCEMNITIFDNATIQEQPSVIRFDVPLQTLYFHLCQRNKTIYYQVYNIQPSNNITLTYPLDHKFTYDTDQITLYWNQTLKRALLLQLNSQNSFDLAEYMYDWIDEKFINSFKSIKMDLFDKYIVVNLTPDYSSTTLVELLYDYIWEHILDYIQKNSQRFQWQSQVYQKNIFQNLQQ
eukprot:403337295